MTYTQQLMFPIYQMDWQFKDLFGIDLDYMKNLVVQGFLSQDGFKQIVGEDYEESSAQPAN